MNKSHCPQHGPMRLTKTQYGSLWVCDHPGCTVKRWGGSTSLPADEATRHARHVLHKIFDPLWQDDHGAFAAAGFNGRNARRRRAYQWLAGELGIDVDQTHFGMFTLEQCAAAKAIIEKAEIAISDMPQL